MSCKSARSVLLVCVVRFASRLRCSVRARTVRTFIESDTELHRIIVTAAGNATLASLIQGFSGRMLRARLWRSITEEGTVEITKKRHVDIYEALRARDPDASAADLVHLSDGERSLVNARRTSRAVRCVSGAASPPRG
jgi:DNA-binding FadR family transcriptional regulator